MLPLLAPITVGLVVVPLTVTVTPLHGLDGGLGVLPPLPHDELINSRNKKAKRQICTINFISVVSVLIGVYYFMVARKITDLKMVLYQQ
jgi:hypothetical protein